MSHPPEPTGEENENENRCLAHLTLANRVRLLYPLRETLSIRVVGEKDLEKIRSGEVTIPEDLLYSVTDFSVNTKELKRLRLLFPRLTKLTFNSESLLAWKKASQLLRMYKRKLKSLRMGSVLKLVERMKHEGAVLGQLTKAINAQTALSSLSMTHYSLSPRRDLLSQLTATLFRVERFTVEASLLQDQANTIRDNLSFRCTHLRLRLSSELANFSLPNCRNLTHLDLEYTQVNVLQCLAQLPKLSTLILLSADESDLNTVLSKMRPQSDLTQVTLLGMAYRRPLERARAQTFPSIAGLTLQLSMICRGRPFNAQTYLTTLASWFPRLSVCSLKLPDDYREGVVAIPEGALPYTLKLLTKVEPQNIIDT